MGNTQYLERRHNTWHVVVEIPKPLRSKAGQKRFKKGRVPCDGVARHSEAARERAPK